MDVHSADIGLMQKCKNFFKLTDKGAGLLATNNI